MMMSLIAPLLFSVAVVVSLAAMAATLRSHGRKALAALTGGNVVVVRPAPPVRVLRRERVAPVAGRSSVLMDRLACAA